MTTHFKLAPLEFPGDLHPTAARVELGLTLYLDDPGHWARDAAPRLAATLIEYAPAGALKWFTTSTSGTWRRVGDAEGLRQVHEGFATQGHRLGTHLRHGFYFQLADDPGAPSSGFFYREIDPSRTDRVSVLELTLPIDSDPGLLFQLAMEASALGPLWSGVGGYALRSNWQTRRVAMTHAYKWCGRWWGIDIQDPDEMAWFARAGLPGTGWLTLVGAPLVARLEIAPEQLQGWPEGIIALPRPHGTLIRAGEAPTEGDLNRFAFPEAYAAVARRLAPFFVPEPPELWGLFGGREQTAVWMRRLVDPEAWGAREA